LQENKPMNYFITISVVVMVAVVFFFLGKDAPSKEAGFNLVSKQEGRLKKGLEYLDKNKEITNEQYRELTGVTARQAVRDLDELEKQGIIRQVGKTGKYTKYTKI